VGLQPEVEAVQSFAADSLPKMPVGGSTWSCFAVQFAVAVVLKRYDLQVDYYDCFQLLDMIVLPDMAAALDHYLNSR
jgi:hypothetical protein